MTSEVRRIQDVKVPCPYCGAVNRMIVDMVESMYFVCPGCSRTVFTYGNLLISLRTKDMEMLEHVFNSESIGNLTGYDFTSRYSDGDNISEATLQEIRSILDSEDPLSGILKL